MRKLCGGVLERASSLLLLSAALVLTLLGTRGAVYADGTDGAADHLVISEVQVQHAEFVELYNPTHEPINLTGWRWCYFSPSKTTWADPDLDETFPDGATIDARSFYLIGLTGYPTSGGNPNADWQPYDSNQLSHKSGTVGIFSSWPSVDTRVDAVAWGDAILKEGGPATVPDSDQSVERKASGTSTSETLAPGGSDAFRGNGHDTDDNSQDFVLRANPQPQNSSSPPEPGPPASVTAAADPQTIVADGVSTATVATTVMDMYANPVADGTVVTFATDLGTLGDPSVARTTTEGLATATLTSGDRPGPATVTATAGTVSATAVVEFTRPIGGRTYAGGGVLLRHRLRVGIAGSLAVLFVLACALPLWRRASDPGYRRIL